MNTFVLDDHEVSFPDWVTDHLSFRRWVHSETFPEEGRICYLQGEVWVDISKEQIFSHNQVKNECAFVLTGLSKTWKKGRYFPDGVLLVHPGAELSSQPDGIFGADETFDSGLIRLVEGMDEGFVELEGTADMVLEVVSTSSVKKDTDTLFDLYWKAGVSEYWLIDARGARLSFEIYQHTSRGYKAAKKAGGWVKSAVFQKSFRLRREQDARGNPTYSLDVKG